MEAMVYSVCLWMPQHAPIITFGGIAILQALCTILQNQCMDCSLGAQLCYGQTFTEQTVSE